MHLIILEKIKYFCRIIETDETCPICSEHVDPKSVPNNLDIRPYLYKIET